MLKLSPRHQIAIGIALAALMVATRGHHFPTLNQMLPSASWAVFFLTGVYLRPVWLLPALLGLAAFLDYAAITWSGVSDFCVSPAYIALIPAYGALWFAGRWYAARYRFHPEKLQTGHPWPAALASIRSATLTALAGSVFVGTLVCELISSGSFYYFSGRFVDTTFTEFAGRLAMYFPSSLAALAFWVGVAAVVHTAVLWRYGAGKPAAI